MLLTSESPRIGKGLVEYSSINTSSFRLRILTKGRDGS
jgi:hypothetical protein